MLALTNDVGLTINGGLRITQKYQIPLGLAIASGAQGSIFAVRNVKTRVKCAMKLIFGPSLTDEQTSRVISEVKLLYELESPYLITLVDVTFSSYYYVIVTDWCNGGTLLNRCEALKWKFEESMKVAVFKQILEALKYLASKEILHSDLKLENIMFVNAADATSTHKDDWALKIVDFGLAVDLSGGKKTSGFYGTLPYMCPEVVSNATYDCAYDMWTLGVIMFTILSEGYFPFGSTEDGDELFLNIVNRNFISSIAESANIEARHLMHCLLQVDPKKRLTAAQALEHVYVNPSSGTISHETIGLTDVWPRPTGRSMRRRSQRVAVIATSMLYKAYKKAAGSVATVMSGDKTTDARTFKKEDVVLFGKCDNCKAKKVVDYCFYCGDKYVYTILYCSYSLLYIAYVFVFVFVSGCYDRAKLGKVDDVSLPLEREMSTFVTPRTKKDLTTYHTKSGTGLFYFSPLFVINSKFDLLWYVTL